MEALDKHIEAILFSAEQPVGVAELVDTLNKAHDLDLDLNVVENHLEILLEKYDDEIYPFEVVNSGGGYQFLSKSDYHKTISIFLNLKSRRKLSVAAMETLSIIAYKQPVTKPDIENIRGVNCDYSIQKLLEKDLIAIVGRSESPGKPLLYGTSKTFMDYFGINTLDDLPKLKEFEHAENTLGVPGDAIDQDAMAALKEGGERLAEAAKADEEIEEILASAEEQVESTEEATEEGSTDTEGIAKEGAEEDDQQNAEEEVENDSDSQDTVEDADEDEKDEDSEEEVDDGEEEAEEPTKA